MPVFLVDITNNGVVERRLVRADTAAKARAAYIPKLLIQRITVDELADLINDGLTLENADALQGNDAQSTNGSDDLDVGNLIVGAGQGMVAQASSLSSNGNLDANATLPVEKYVPINQSFETKDELVATGAVDPDASLAKQAIEPQVA